MDGKDDIELCLGSRSSRKEAHIRRAIEAEAFHCPRSGFSSQLFAQAGWPTGPTWDHGIDRFTEGLERLSSGRSRVKLAATSALRWLRHLRWPEERRHQACAPVLAACGWVTRMNGLEQRIYRVSMAPIGSPSQIGNTDQHLIF